MCWPNVVTVCDRTYVGPKEGRHTVEEYLAGDDWSELCESPMRNDERTDE